VAEERGSLRVLSVASGCKSAAPAPGAEAAFARDLCVVKDAHAEVLARRGLRKALHEDLRRLRSGEPGLLGLVEDDAGSFRKSVRLHMYTSSSPCGDASIYDVDGVWTFTGAKLPDWRRETTQLLGKTRLKPARSDAARRSTSFSCTDKLCRWCLTGLEGALLSAEVRGSLFLESLVVGAEDDRRVRAVACAARRGVVDRARHAATELGLAPRLPRVASTTVLPRQCRQAKKKPSHLAACWWLGLDSRDVEVLVAATGRPLGSTKQSSRRSRLSTAALFEEAVSSSQGGYLARKASAPTADLARAVADFQLRDFPADHPLRKRPLGTDAGQDDDDDGRRRHTAKQPRTTGGTAAVVGEVPLASCLVS